MLVVAASRQSQESLAAGMTEGWVQHQEGGSTRYFRQAQDRIIRNGQSGHLVAPVGSWPYEWIPWVGGIWLDSCWASLRME